MTDWEICATLSGRKELFQGGGSLVGGIDFLLVPSGTISDGSIEGTVTEFRLQVACELYRSSVNPVQIIVSGGFVRSRQEQADSDADLMAEWLIDQGIPSTAIIRERQAVDTYENIYFSFLIVDDVKGGSTLKTPVRIGICSEEHHLRRFAWSGRWIQMVRFFQGLTPLKVSYHPTGPQLSRRERFMENVFLLAVHVPDPLGCWHPLVHYNRFSRHRAASK